MTFEEKTVGTERIYEGKIINVRRDQVTVQNGTSYRETHIPLRGCAAVAVPRGRRSSADESLRTFFALCRL